MAKLQYIYVPVASISKELQEIAYRFKQVEDGFVIIQNKWAAWPKSADAIFDEKHRRYDATHSNAVDAAK